MQCSSYFRTIEKILRDFLNDICLIYLDDVMVMAKSFDGMLDNLHTIFVRIRNANSKLHRKKCNFFQREVEYLGHIVSEKGINTDPKIIEATVNWPIPSCKKQVKSFTGFCSYYRRFVKGFSSFAKPLYRLLTVILSRGFFRETQGKCQSRVRGEVPRCTNSPLVSKNYRQDSTHR